MRVYTATRADFEPLQKLYYAASSRQAAAAGDYYIATEQDYYLFVGMVESANGDVLVVKEGERIMGMAIVSVTDRPLSPNISDRRYVRVSSLIFKSVAARDLLISEAELWAFARNINYLQVSLHANDTEAIKLHTGMGFLPETTLYSRQIPREEAPIGLPRGTVKLYPYSHEWKLEGERTVAELKRILRLTALGVEHVGSTAIPSMPAKPIIDVVVVVKYFDKLLAKQDRLREHGYYRVPTDNTEDQMLFAKGSFYDGTGDLQTHFIHIVDVDSYAWYDYLNFRNYLKEFDDVAARYAELKIHLALENPTDREKYTAGKHDFIQYILPKASRHFHR